MEEVKSGKRCKKCDKVKSVTAFSKNKAAKDGLLYQCIQCRKEYRANISPERKAARRIRTKKYKQDNKEVIAKKSKEYREDNKLAIENDRYLRRYGITSEDYYTLHTHQEGKCKICKQPEKATHRQTKEVRNLAVDHCHTTGLVRGLLCDICNRGLGYFKDNIEFLENAKQYLRDAYGE